METKRDYSYGVIPLFREEESWKIFLINQYGHGGDVYWTFPKGHAEGEETPLQAALRELREETALRMGQVEETQTYTQEYSFMDGGIRIKKVVIYYCGIAASKVYQVQEEEVKEAGWFTPEEAFQKLTFDPAKEMLRRVLEDRQA